LPLLYRKFFFLWLDVGDKLLSRTHVDKTDDKGKAVAEALQIARQKHDVELRNTIEQLRQEAEREKHKALAAARKVSGN
jgi:hypothetical protein